MVNVSEKELSKASTHVNKNDSRKVGMSCAECRRSKLKCDRTFPCSACVRRGCANICPDGTLTATKGNKVLQSQNEALLQSVRRLKSRVRDLEDALAKTQAQISPQPHPLLEGREPSNEPDPEQCKEEEDEVDEASQLVGSLSIGEQGQARFHGQSSASEFLQTLLPNSEDDPLRTLHPHNMYRYGLPQSIIDLINAFPFSIVTPAQEVKAEILSYLPNHNKALAIALLYFEHVNCLYQVLQQDKFVSHLFEVLLGSTQGLTVGEKLHSHQLAVIYLVLAIGSILSEDVNDRAESEKYYLAACAAMSISPIVKEATGAAVEALFLMVQYFNRIDSPACDRQWLWSGVMFRLAYSIGLQRDPGIWNLNEEETQRRRTLFWELYSWDTFKSILYGRPPSLNISYTDCRFPEDKSNVYNAKEEKEMSFEAYKYRFSAFILTPVVNHIFGVRQQNYQTVLDIDTKLRKLQPPSWLQAPTRGKGEPVDGRAWNADPIKAVQQYTILCYRECTLLYIHRRYFATAIKLNNKDPLRTKYGASVMAACRSACLLLSSLRSLYGAYPCLASRQTFFWSGAFSAIIVLGCLVYNSPGCSISADAMSAIDDGVHLYSLRLFDDDNQPKVKMLAVVRDSVRGMLDHYKRHVQLSRDDFIVRHEGECATMRILEGSSVLINMNLMKTDASASAGQSTSSSSPSVSSGQGSEGSSPASSSEPSEGAHDRQGKSGGGWTGDLNDENADFRMLDFSGVYYTPDPVQLHHAPSYASPSVYLPLETGPEEGTSGNETVQPAQPSKLSGQQEGLAVPQADSGYRAPTTYGEAEPMVVQDAAMPTYSAPGVQYDPSMGAADMYLLNQNGYMAQYDQAGWESFLREMGMPSTNAR
ncbi:hypothetical protein ACEPAF_890 [Sanghuangporus sanghuang]